MFNAYIYFISSYKYEYYNKTILVCYILLYIMYSVDSDFLLPQSQVFKLFIHEYRRFTENIP